LIFLFYYDSWNWFGLKINFEYLCFWMIIMVLNYIYLQISLNLNKICLILLIFENWNNLLVLLLNKPTLF
jgi:hypothetical protein